MAARYGALFIYPPDPAASQGRLSRHPHSGNIEGYQRPKITENICGPPYGLQKTCLTLAIWSTKTSFEAGAQGPPHLPNTKRNTGAWYSAPYHPKENGGVCGNIQRNSETQEARMVRVNGAGGMLWTQWVVVSDPTTTGMLP